MMPAWQFSVSNFQPLLGSLFTLFSTIMLSFISINDDNNNIIKITMPSMIITFMTASTQGTPKRKSSGVSSEIKWMHNTPEELSASEETSLVTYALA